MSPTTTLYHHKGTSTILGTLIFVSIVFSAYIPMMIVMSQADTLYDVRKHELGILDQERGQEEVFVYVYPAEDATTLTLKIMNRGNLVIEVVQIWINDDYIPVNVQISPMDSETITLNQDYQFIPEDYQFIPEDGHYYLFKIYTARGNAFSPDSGSLHYIGGGTWEGGVFALNFYISYPEAGWYDIEIREVDEDGDLGILVGEYPFLIHKSSSGPAFAFRRVDNAGSYQVKVTKNSNPIHEGPYTISTGFPVVWVFV